MHANRMGLKRALSNLIGNAFMHGEHVRLSGLRTNQSVHLAVEDDGPGIAKEDRERALQPFERLDPARNQSGTGLGLSVVNDIVKRHGGSLELLDAELGGLKALIRLPG
ncbi:MAG: ATP-binding protein [Pseudomonadota bacterium]